MRYNPKASLKQDQVEIARGRAGGHTFADRFSKMDGEQRTESSATKYYRGAMKKRMQKRGEWYGG